MHTKQEFFSSIFESYEEEPTRSIKLKEIRTRFGGEVKQALTFEEAKVENMPTTLCKGDFAPFLADLEFNNVKFITLMQVRGDYE